MKIRFSPIINVMIWMTLPMMVGLGYWEHTLPLSPTGHKLIQLLTLPIVFGWFYFWNRLAEYHQLYLLVSHPMNPILVEISQNRYVSPVKDGTHTDIHVTSSYPMENMYDDSTD
ncbi:MAG TPA: hypothetical protein VHO48_14970 [Anaerolineaceae bacterium]|nr:hypothetical protein [Anaerolineaceae bacterium]